MLDWHKKHWEWKLSPFQEWWLNWIDVVKVDMPNQNCFLKLKLRWLNKPTPWLNTCFFDYTIFTNMLLWQNQHGASSNNNEAFYHLRHWLNLSGHTNYVGWRKHDLYWFTSAIFVGNIHWWLNAEAIQVQYRLVNLIPILGPAYRGFQKYGYPKDPIASPIETNPLDEKGSPMSGKLHIYNGINGIYDGIIHCNESITNINQLFF